MELYLKLIDVLFPVFFVIGIGYYLGKKNPDININYMAHPHFYTSCKSGSIEIVKLLIDKGAKITERCLFNIDGKKSAFVEIQTLHGMRIELVEIQID